MKGLMTKAAVAGLSLALAGCVGMTRSELEQSGYRASFEVSQPWKTTYRYILQGYQDCFIMDPTLLMPSAKVTTQKYDDLQKAIFTDYFVGPYGGRKITNEVIIRSDNQNGSIVDIVGFKQRGVDFLEKTLRRWSTGDLTCP